MSDSMTKLIPIDTTPHFAPRENAAAPIASLMAHQSLKHGNWDTALAEAAKWGKIRTGIWEATPGTTVSIKGDTFEFCHILSGRAEISEDGGATYSFGGRGTVLCSNPALSASGKHWKPRRRCAKFL